MSTIVLGISSGIAAYKAVDLVQLLMAKGHEVHVMMTTKASYMISPGKIEEITGNPVLMDLFDDHFSYEDVLKSRKVDHIEMARKADLIVIAPATANTIAKMASGIADDFLTTTLLAASSPVLICPSMNDRMWYHPATTQNLEKLESFGYEILTPATGALACGTDGIGRLPEPTQIAEEIERILERSHKLQGKHVIVTGGGTMEAIDDVRVITNRGSGKMGKALAEICYRYGAHVTFLHSKNSVTSNLPIKQIAFSSSDELANCLTDELKNSDIIFHTAAVSDFSTDKNAGKIDSSKEILLSLKPTPKIINKIKELNPSVLLIGFKAIVLSSQTKRQQGAEIWDPEKENSIPHQVQDDSKKLFTDAHADFVVVNDISRTDIGFESDENEVYVVSKDQKVHKIEKASKMCIAEKLVQHLLK
ncbi:bifunctional phosphopantothenoylcysteine decarboxylase/phosphopantothenate--cysteine ligase CoaBC [Candidatus Woesebacteria bacterium]|nr:bifunctional phosphopantothenoylcysteine decarboxylase/phosphopantothenate--cysteine ligase CoaBC [Candidatus Woesebacteria bacterium]